MQQAVPLDVGLDAKAVFDATSAREGKLSSEKALILHQLAFKQMASSHLIRALFWMDTGDCLADALTKGAISRTALQEIATRGNWTVSHEFKRFIALSS